MDNNWRDVTINDLNAALSSVVHDSDPVAAKNLIIYFHQRFDDIGLDGCPQGAIGILCQYMEHVFNKMVVDKYSAEQAFGLKLPRGKYSRSNTFNRDLQITAYMVLLMRQGKKWEEAKGDAANRFLDIDKGDKAAEAAYARNKDIFKIGFFSDEELEEIAKDGLRP